MAWWGWIVVGLILLVAEIATPSGLFLLFFGVSALFVGLLSWLQLLAGPEIQWSVFIVCSLIAFYFLYRKRSLVSPGKSRDDTDSLIGVRATAAESIAPAAFGKVEVRGSSWNARNVGTSPIAPGGHCEVVGIDGLTLSVK